MKQGAMSPQYWDEYLKGRLELIKKVLGNKAQEYAPGMDRMHNFNRAVVAAAGKHKTREDAMFGMMLKHWVSILDIVDALGDGTLPKAELVKEKFGDMINYLLLMEGSILHTIDTKGGGVPEPKQPIAGADYDIDASIGYPPKAKFIADQQGTMRWVNPAFDGTQPIEENREGRV